MERRIAELRYKGTRPRFVDAGPIGVRSLPASGAPVSPPPGCRIQCLVGRERPL